jgi:hypothetical protein
MMRGMSEHLFTTSKMARRLGVETGWLRSEAEAGRVPAVPAGNTYLFAPAVVERALLERARRYEGAGHE